MTKKLNTCWFDTETMGLYGPPVVLQAQFDYETANHDDQPFLYDLWRQPVQLTIQLIEEIVTCRVVAHNLTFDWQKISQFYNAIKGLAHVESESARPIDHIEEMADLIYSEKSKFCLKPPAAVCTLMLCQKSIGGAALATKEIRVRKLPPDAAQIVCDMLNKMTDLPEILFARRNSDERWAVAQNDESEEWVDVALRFAPSNALKDIARLVLGVDDTQKIGEDFQCPVFPYECGYAPYAVLLENDDNERWKHNFFHKQSKSWRQGILWPRLIVEHIDFWTTPGTPQAKYALDDIVLLKQLDEHLGSIESDFDSELGCQVASVRTAGLGIDAVKLEEQVRSSNEIVDKAELNVNSHVAVKKWIAEALDPMEALVIAEGCDKDRLKKLTTSMVLDKEETCCRKGCVRCDGKGTVGPGPMPVVDRARHILKIRKHKKRLQLYNKLRLSKSAYPSFRVIGTKSGRMSGTDGLNYHGIDGSREIREVFTFAQEGWIVSGGDMNSQELAIAAVVMNDVNLESDIGEGKSLHGVFAASASGLPYDQIMRNKEDKGTPEAAWYKKAKICVYAILYGAAAFNISQTLGCTPEEAEQIIEDFFKKYPYMAQTRKLVKQSLEALRSDADGRLQVVRPKQQHIDSIFGFRRSFETEFAAMNIMFHVMKEWQALTKKHSRMPGNPLAPWESSLQDTMNRPIDILLDRKIVRKEAKGSQTVKSAVSSALFGAVFSLQGKILRAALNHLIQSAGRTCTLRVQKRIWDEVQPVGVHEFLIKLLSVHDEIVTASPPEYGQVIEDAVSDEMALLCKEVPLLSLDWATNVGSWYGVKAAVSQEDYDTMAPEDQEKAVIAERFVRCGWEG